MPTKYEEQHAQIKAIIAANMTNPAMLSFQVYLNDLLFRNPKTEKGPRWTNLTTGTPIESFQDLLDAIEANGVEFNAFCGELSLKVDFRHVVATINNVEGEFLSHFVEDERFLYQSGSAKRRMSFLLAYLNDASLDLPIKVESVRLTKVL